MIGPFLTKKGPTGPKMKILKEIKLYQVFIQSTIVPNFNMIALYFWLL